MIADMLDVLTAGQVLCLVMLGAGLGVAAGHAVAYRIGRWLWSPRRVIMGRAVARSRRYW